MNSCLSVICQVASSDNPSDSPRRKFYSRRPLETGGYIWSRETPHVEDSGVPDTTPPIRLVIADDHQIVLQGLQNMLHEKHNIEVVGVAHDARESMTHLLEHRPDVLLTDLNMPGRNGLEMIAEIRRAFPDLPIVVLSMYRDARIRKGLKQHGVAAYLLKSTGQNDLAEVISRVHRGQPVAMPEINHLDDGEFDVELGVDLNITDRFVAKFALGKREMEIFQLIALGKSSQEIADELHISIETVHSHRKNIKFKTGMKNSAEIAAFAVRNGLI